MSKATDVGISPVLLQAISQSLSSTNSSKSHSSTASSMSSSLPPSNGKGAASSEDLFANMIRQQREQIEADSGAENVDKSGASEAIKTMLKIKMAANAMATSALANSQTDELLDRSNINISNKGNSESKADKDELSASGVRMGSLASDLAMANVLTALASQSGHAQMPVTLDTGQVTPSVLKLPVNNGRGAKMQLDTDSLIESEVQEHELKPEECRPFSSTNYTIIKSEPGITNLIKTPSGESMKPSLSRVSALPAIESDTQTFVSSEENSEVSHSSDGALVSDSIESTAKTKADNSFVFALNPMAMPGTSSVQNIIDVGSANSVRVIEHNGKRYIIQMQDIEQENVTSVSSGVSNETEETILRYSAGQDGGESLPYTNVAEHEVVTVGQQQELSTMSSATCQMPSNVTMNGQPCPVCADNVSGFHYGIFTCESCKGFFKRTVQNKKTFVCPRQGECEITLENRKKCPACRFAKCLVMGMKLEAIRHDRTRGGRSSYGGSSPLDEPKKKRPMKVIQPRRPSNPQSSESSTLVSVLSGWSGRSDKPFVPQILTEIMSLESLLSDDDIPSNISIDDFSLSNPNVFVTLLQLCELKLYKIVRWARNLPYFANISTDDQILLLQNCWCELLALTMCWKSLHLTNEIVFFHGQSIDQEKADMLNLSEMFSKMLAVVEQFKRLKLDQYECVALKVIILICPDIKGLGEDVQLSEQQQKVSLALEQYVSSHYPHTPNKYGEILLRLPELSRISGMMKDQLVNWMPSNTTSCGLLYELLKGENMKDLL